MFLLTKYFILGCTIPSINGRYCCFVCDRSYRYKTSWYKHRKYECGKEPQFRCSFCSYRSHRKGNLLVHLRRHWGTLPVPESSISIPARYDSAS